MTRTAAIITPDKKIILRHDLCVHLYLVQFTIKALQKFEIISNVNKYEYKTLAL